MKYLSNKELDQNMQHLARQERALLAEVLLCIREIDKRRLYASMAYSSLFEYLTKKCAYSAGAAQRRIDAARLMNDVPELSQKIESGELTLSQISNMQKAIRQLKKESKTVSCEQKRKLVQSLVGLSESQAQQQIAKTLNIQIQKAPKVRHQADNSVRVELTFTQEQWELIKQAQAALSHQVPSGDLSAVLTKMSEITIAQKRSSKSTATVAVKNSTLTSKTKKLILTKDKQCQFKDPHTQKTCGSKWQLEVDHIQPRWAGGDHNQEHLQVLCRTHNLYKYRRGVGRKS